MNRLLLFRETNDDVKRFLMFANTPASEYEVKRYLRCLLLWSTFGLEELTNKKLHTQGEPLSNLKQLLSFNPFIHHFVFPDSSSYREHEARVLIEQATQIMDWLQSDDLAFVKLSEVDVHEKTPLPERFIYAYDLRNTMQIVTEWRSPFGGKFRHDVDVVKVTNIFNERFEVSISCCWIPQQTTAHCAKKRRVTKVS